MFGIGGPELLVILVVALLFVGPDKLPQVAKTLTSGLRDLRRAANLAQAELRQTVDDLAREADVDGLRRDLHAAVHRDNAMPAAGGATEPAHADGGLRPNRAARDGETIAVIRRQAAPVLVDAPVALAPTGSPLPPPQDVPPVAVRSEGAPVESTGSAEPAPSEEGPPPLPRSFGPVAGTTPHQYPPRGRRAGSGFAAAPIAAPTAPVAPAPDDDGEELPPPLPVA